MLKIVCGRLSTVHDIQLKCITSLKSPGIQNVLLFINTTPKLKKFIPNSLLLQEKLSHLTQASMVLSKTGISSLTNLEQIHRNYIGLWEWLSHLVLIKEYPSTAPFLLKTLNAPLTLYISSFVYIKELYGYSMLYSFHSLHRWNACSWSSRYV